MRAARSVPDLPTVPTESGNLNPVIRTEMLLKACTGGSHQVDTLPSLFINFIGPFRPICIVKGLTVTARIRYVQYCFQ